MPYHFATSYGTEGKGTLVLPTNLSDEELIARAKAYDEAVLQAIYEQYSPNIFRYIYYRIGDYDAAEDLRAEVFVKMLEGLDSFTYQGWGISAWLYRIAHDRVVDHLRRMKRRQHEPLQPYVVDPADGPDTISLSRLDHADLRAALSQLTDEQAEVIILRFLQDHSLREVAQITGRTEGAIKALPHRALQALGRLLGPVRDL
jgi:RNA polymerase sigma-70 factor, ECF subfamily